MIDVEKQLEDARQNLLDLTMRNRLLNFRPTKARTIRIIDEIPREVYDLLILQEKTMGFLPLDKEQDLDSNAKQRDLMEDEPENDNLNLDEGDSSKLWELPPPDGEIATRHTDRFLQTPFESENLQKRLYYISQQAKSVLEEQGYTILYLALGFLEWTESPDSIKPRRAPLLLIPVELERAKIGAAFKLVWTGEDIFANISLQAKLEEQGVLLPDFQLLDEKHGIDSYLQSVTESISKKSDWRVLNDIYLDFFSFTKFVMYKDLDPTTWPDGKKPSDNLLIKYLFDPVTQEFDLSFSEDDVDKILDVRDQYHVMDADPSQIAVIEDVKSGHNLVVEGPPGTGKSQTITNIIAELLATGKSVLFVSEKMAALEVVKNRLDDVGIGEFCLELHSRKSNKKEVLKKLEHTLSKPRRQSKSLSDDFSRLESLKTELNNYAAALREPIGLIGRTPFNLFYMKENAIQHCENMGRAFQRIDISNADQCNQDHWASAQSTLTNIAEALPLVKPIRDHPWNWCSLDTLLPSDESAIGEMLDDCINSIGDLGDSIDELVEICAVQRPTNINDLKYTVYASKVIAISKPVDTNILLNNDWDNQNDSALLLIQKVESLQKQLSGIHSKFDANPTEKIVDENRNDLSYVDLFHLISGAGESDQNIWVDLRLALSNLADALPLIKPISSHSQNSYSSDMVIQSDENIGEKLIGAYNASIDYLEDSIDKLVEICAIQRPANISDLRHVIFASKVIAKSKPVDRNLLLNCEWDKPNDLALLLIQKVDTLQKQLPNIHSKFNEKAIKTDIDSILEEYEQSSDKSFLYKLLSIRYRYLKRVIKSSYKAEPPKDVDDVLSDLNELSAHIKLKNEIGKSSDMGASFFGSYWEGEKSDFQMLQSFAEWVVTFRQQLSKNVFNNHILDIVSSGVSHEDAKASIEMVSDAEMRFIESYENLTKYIDYNLNTYKEKSKHKFVYDHLCIQFNYLKRAITHTKGTHDIISDLNELLTCIQLLNEIEKSNEMGSAFFGSYWKGENSDSQKLQSIAEWIVTFRNQLLKNMFNDHVLETVSRGVSQEDVEKSIEKMLDANEYFVDCYEKLINRLDTNHKIVFDTEMELTPFNDLLSCVKLWKNELPKLQRWTQYTKRRKACLDSIAAPIIEAIESNELESEDIIPCFEGNFADSLLHSAFAERPAIADFVGDLHENKIRNFTELDSQLIIKNRQRLAQKLSSDRPNTDVSASRSSELGILQGEFNRKRRHMPIRKLMVEAGGLIQKIKPCFMMSPLSIAQFLDPKVIKFDVVIFDEASQVKPEDSFGALLRGNQAVVIGDTRQLPPTSFFDSMVASGEEEEDETAPIKDIESILHLCKSSFQTKILRWHYRSKHESLIAVSNQEFYDNQLVIYPSPIDNLDHLGLKFIHLPNAVYDRGKSSANRIEARAVAKAAVEHYRKYPDKSLGVGTFNIKQQQAILEEVELQLRGAPEMENFFKSTNHDHFFVKNLETIQGDERDVILISIGFGYDLNRKLSKNFGPINRDGGERRLNVLITRAREKCVVFSNFQANDLSLDANSPYGLKSLKIFLDYAENRNLISMESEKIDSDSPFEDSVYDLLLSCGYHVQKQVGCAGYRIDLALINPKHPGRYLLGIECDGAKYHSSSVARDRDRLRQQNLEKLGWNIYRIWSTDWYRNRTECKQKLIDALELAMSNSEKEPELIDITINSCDPSMQIAEGDEVDQQDGFDILYTDDQIDEIIPDYVLCSSLNVNMYGQLHKQTTETLAKAIIQIVEIESPVHFEEVVRRIRTHCGLGRAGNRIKDAIDRAVTYATRMGHVNRQGDFIWSNNGTVQVRCRRGDPPAKIEYICDEEIAEAIKMVLIRQFATPLDDLIVQSSRLFGIQSTRGAISERIRKIIDSLVKLDELQYLSNGMIDLNNN